MKANIKQQFESAISDNKTHIKAYGGNIREYFETDYVNQDQGHCFYLTDEEVSAWEKSEVEAERLNNEIIDFLYQYDVDIEKYLNEEVNPAY